MIKEEIRFENSTVMEGMTSISALFAAREAGINDRTIEKILFDKEKKAKILVTTAFWHHPLDDALREYASERGLPCIELGDLGEEDTMKALGLFEHDGVANHPGDLGMQRIAERITETLFLEYQ